MVNSPAAFSQYANLINPFKASTLRAIGIPYFHKAHGCYLYDQHDNAYLDLVAGFGAHTLGHYHPVLAESMQAAMRIGKPTINPWSIFPESEKLAEELITLTRGQFSKVYFANTGAEAVESALKFAMAATQRNAFIAIKNGFHGLTIAATQLAGHPFWQTNLPVLPIEVMHVPINDINKLKILLKTKHYAAVIVEPIQGSSGEGVWQADALRMLAELAKANGTILILDEVMTGIGRVGSWFAYQALCPDLAAEILITSKGLTGGMLPLSTVLMTDDIYLAMFGGKAAGRNHAATFSENYLAMTCGLTVLSILKSERLLENVRRMGCYFQESLNQLMREQLPIKNVNVHGLTIAFKIDKRTSVRCAADVCVELAQQRILTTLAPHHEDYIRLTPPFIIQKNDIDVFIKTLKTCF